jgi:predicted restriction endonuclease
MGRSFSPEDTHKIDLPVKALALCLYGVKEVLHWIFEKMSISIVADIRATVWSILLWWELAAEGRIARSQEGREDGKWPSIPSP